MQFVANGPDIPDTLIQAHEDGRVVFFCGAGVSYPAGLPGFEGLVDDIYLRLGTPKEPIEVEAFNRKQFDATLDLLERRYPGQRVAVRRVLADALVPKLRKKGATDTHVALLQLAKSRDGAFRIVTTNFDRVFEHVIRKTKHACNSHAAPMLPIPKNSKWNGLVYLHGLLPPRPDDNALNRLVVSSGDFGLAYLTERWASRFVSELFRNYIVCFVGYSINDPVLRYMMDAIAADRMLGETSPQAYALGDFASGSEAKKINEWKSKGVTPILYEVQAGTHDHSALHKTLKAWAETYRDGILGRERIVSEYSLTRPSASTTQDDFIGRMLWALSHESGLPAKRLAEGNPVALIDWLEALSLERFGHDDLSRFGVSPPSSADSNLRFSFVWRPAPYQYAPRMTLLGQTDRSRWDQVMHHIARWLVRHLNDPTLMYWMIARGRHVSEEWAWLIKRELTRIAKLETDGKTAELAEIRANAPNAIPTPLMRTLWNLLLNGRVKSLSRDHNLYDWFERLASHGFTASQRLELRELLAPMVALRKPYRWRDEETDDNAPATSIRQIVDWELELATDHPRSAVEDLGKQWASLLPQLLDEFQLLLKDALDLLRELEPGDDQSDRSFWDMPSISQHWQNRGFREWVVLIELLRDAWVATKSVDLARASRIAVHWFEMPYATFKRLALFAAAQEGAVPPRRWLDWLAGDGSWWLWIPDTQREVMRLLVSQGNRLAGLQAELERAVLAGPPRAMYDSDLEADEWDRLVDRAVWLRLKKLASSGAQLGPSAQRRLAAIDSQHAWAFGSHEREEFPSWMSGSGDPDYQESRDIDVAPRIRRDLVEWLKKEVPPRRPFYEDTWRETCRTRPFRALGALKKLSEEEHWPIARWREALQTLSEDALADRTWRFAATTVASMPQAVLKELVQPVAYWLHAVSKVEAHRHLLLLLCDRVLDFELEGWNSSAPVREIPHPVSDAINQPVGYVAQALIKVLARGRPNDNDGLSADLEPRLSRVCDTTIEAFRPARVIFGSQLILLFRVDRRWTEAKLLPLLRWDTNPIEARFVWEGFLWGPRLYGPLFLAFKEDFLATASRYAQLGEHGEQFARLLTFAAINAMEGYKDSDFQAALATLPQRGLEQSARAFSQAMEGAGEQREEYWVNRAYPFWLHVWPKSRALLSKSISASLARMVISTGTHFPNALAAMSDWLQPFDHPSYVVDRLQKSDLCERFPRDALTLLDKIINGQQWVARELGTSLEKIADAAPRLRRDPRFVRLEAYWRQHATS